MPSDYVLVAQQVLVIGRAGGTSEATRQAGYIVNADLVSTHADREGDLLVEERTLGDHPPVLRFALCNTVPTIRDTGRSIDVSPFARDYAIWVRENRSQVRRGSPQ